MFVTRNVLERRKGDEIISLNDLVFCKFHAFEYGNGERTVTVAIITATHILLVFALLFFQKIFLHLFIEAVLYRDERILQMKTILNSMTSFGSRMLRTYT